MGGGFANLRGAAMSAQQTDFSSARLYSKSNRADGRLVCRPIKINGLDASSRINGDPTGVFDLAPL